MRLVVLSGFLGSGKTSLLLAAARDAVTTQQLNVAVIVNEYSQVGIDDKLFKGEKYHTVELYSGCVCCILQNNLIETIETLVRRCKPDLIFVEPSGIADPANFYKMTKRLQQHADVIKFFSIVDPKRYWQMREWFENLSYNIIYHNDAIFINKSDSCTLPELNIVKQDLIRLKPNATIHFISVKTAENIDIFYKEVYNG